MTWYLFALCNYFNVQVPSLTTSQRFTRGFWKLRQKLFKDIGGKLKNVYGLELSHVHLLRHVSKGDITPSQLVDEMQIPAHGISRILESLESQGFLERALDPNDARKRKLTITQQGTIVLKKAEVIIEKEMNILLSVFSKNDLDQFLKHLETLTKEQ